MPTENMIVRGHRYEEETDFTVELRELCRAWMSEKDDESEILAVLEFTSDMDLTDQVIRAGYLSADEVNFDDIRQTFRWLREVAVDRYHQSQLDVVDAVCQ